MMFKGFRYHINALKGHLHRIPSMCISLLLFFLLLPSMSLDSLTKSPLVLLHTSIHTFASSAHSHIWRRHSDISVTASTALRCYCVKRGQQSENMCGRGFHTQSFSGISQPWPFCCFTVDKTSSAAMTKGQGKISENPCGEKKKDKRRKKKSKYPWQIVNKRKVLSYMTQNNHIKLQH